MSDPAVKIAAGSKRPKQGRSPAYPGIGIKEAIAQAQALYDAEGKYAVPAPSAFKAWGFGEKSSGGREIRAALRYYGLVTNEGDGDVGKIKLTDDALRVLLDTREDQAEKKAIIRRLALKPPIFKILAEEYAHGIKSDPTVEHFLVFEKGYNKAAAAEIVATFKETAAYAEIFEPTAKLDKPPAPVIDKPDIEIGDLVQVQIGGVDMLDKPERVRAVQTHDGNRWVFVESSETGVPMDQAILVEKGAGQAAKPALIPPTLPLKSSAADHQPVSEGEKELLRGPLSREVSYRLIVSGDLGPKEIGKLITILKAQKAVLSDDDDEEKDQTATQ